MQRLAKITWVLFALFLILVIANAWISDDSYITLRTVYNFTKGYGLRWNISERVQVFTHPLWMFLQVPIYALIQHAYLTALGLNILLCAGLGIVLIRCTNDHQAVIAAFLLLMSSKAFIDFSTSGLENALAHFLLLLFFLEIEKKSSGGKHDLKRLALLSSLLLLTRLDFVLLIAPVAVWCLWQSKPWSLTSWKALCWGGLPLILWELFALAYYGTFFPNTYYAKAQTGLPAADLFRQGAHYFLDSLQYDWPTLVLIALAVLWILAKGSAVNRSWAIGILLYLIYIVSVGGDFMSGRFFSVPFLIAVLLIINTPLPKQTLLYLSLGIFGLSLFQPLHPIHIRPSYFEDRKPHVQEIYPHGIVDEKGFAWERSGCLALRPWKHVFNIENILQKATSGAVGTEIQSWEVRVAIGMQGYEAGPPVHIVDQLALSDPLLARLPAERRPNWRVGHYFRKIPGGYLESLQSGADQFEDRDLAEYYRHIHRVVSGPIWQASRWQSIYLLNTGQLEYLIDQAYYQNLPAPTNQ